MKIGIIAGNRLLPLLLAQRIKQKDKNCQVIAFAFRKETDPKLSCYVDKLHWLEAGQLQKLSRALQSEGIKQVILAGQINPLRIFKRKNWDRELISLAEQIKDFRPHAIFRGIIEYLDNKGLEFLDISFYLKEDLAATGLMNDLNIDENLKKDIDFGVAITSGFVELDVGQTVVVKKSSVVGLESLEGTDKTIRRAYRLAGRGCTVLKFSKRNQDFRFDLPVVGISTLRLLRQIQAASLVLEAAKVIILEKQKFLELAKHWKIPVMGAVKPVK